MKDVICWVCPWDICNEAQAQECRAAMGNTKRTRGCGAYFAPGTTLEQARKQIGRPVTELPQNFPSEVPVIGGR
jgi:hypothetical protein